MSDVYFCLINPHDPGTIHSSTPIRVSADVEGKNIRPAHATMARFVSLLGGNAYQVPAPEAATRSRAGIADAITFPLELDLHLQASNQRSTTSLDMPFYLLCSVALFNRAVMDGLSR